MSHSIETRQDLLAHLKKSLFPTRRVWLHHHYSFKPLWRGSDEWGRHTWVVGIPYVVGVVIAHKWCDCEDMRDFACDFPGCPAMGMIAAPDEPSYCLSHDEEFYIEWLAEFPE